MAEENIVEASAAVAATDDGDLAPFYSIPAERIVSIEHPCIVKNLERGVKSLGGEAQVLQIYEHPKEPRLTFDGTPLPPVIGVSLRPGDPFAKKIASTHVPTRNVLLKVALPKRTGRKRKRGSDGPFIESGSPEPEAGALDADDFLRRLRDNSDRYMIEAVGNIPETHRFHNLPDMQMRAAEIPIMRELRDHAMHPKYDILKKFHVDVKPGSEGITHFPAPPSFMPSGPTFYFGYQQHLEPLRYKIPPLRWNGNTEVPQRPPPYLPQSFVRGVEIALPILKELVARRPIFTINVAAHDTPSIRRNHLEIALLYLTFYADAGPWRGTYICYGLDPRLDAQHRSAQTVHLENIPPAPRRRSTKRYVQAKVEEFTFDGQTVANTQQRIYQLCDLSVPALRDLVDTPNVRKECDSKTGWFCPGSVAKIHVLTNQMIASVLKGIPVPTAEHAVIASLPDNMQKGSDVVRPDNLDEMDSNYVLTMLAEVTKAIDEDSGKQTNNEIAAVEEVLAGTANYSSDDDDDGDDDDPEPEPEQDENILDADDDDDLDNDLEI